MCLSEDLIEVMARAGLKRTGVRRCDRPCLPRPQSVDADSATYYADKWDITWCRACVPFNSRISLADIERIERAGNIQLCPVPRRMPRLAREAAGSIIQSSSLGLRRAMQRGGKPVLQHDDIAVLIGNARYLDRMPAKLAAIGDVAAMHAVLTESLGYRPENVIEVKDARQKDFERLFGRDDGDDGRRGGGVTGSLAKRLKMTPGARLFVYVSAFGAISGDDEEPVLLPVDARSAPGKQRQYRLKTLFKTLSQAGAVHATLVLEVDFARSSNDMVLPPNPPLKRTRTLPQRARSRLTVITAADSDQHALEDREHGCSLFTRYLIEAMSGDADAAPLGNGDGVVDTAEAFVFAAHKSGMAAHKMYGMMQRPRISFAVPVALGPVAVGKPRGEAGGRSQ